MREVYIEVPKTSWDDIGGQDHIKQKLKEAVEWPLLHPEAFKRMGIRPPRGILLYGPPGCSKTLMAKALAHESSRNFIAIKGPELFSKWVGESEKAIRDVFRRARAASPSIVFFDEIDSIASHRSSSSSNDDGNGGGGGGGGGGDNVSDRVLSQLLVELDGVEELSDVTVIAATNRPDIIDRALMRPGRIDRILYVGPPDRKSAQQIFKIHLKSMSCAEDIDVEKLSSLVDGYTGAEIAAVCREAAVLAMEENLLADRISMTDLLNAIAAFKPRLSPQVLKMYEQYQYQSGIAPLVSESCSTTTSCDELHHDDDEDDDHIDNNDNVVDGGW